ncbi:hypothetical protein Vi05172_g10459 [Venturia inaequalis]|nr:hypothetical protein Vi05172_g10459 [Venturia inaequalis]
MSVACNPERLSLQKLWHSDKYTDVDRKMELSRARSMMTDMLKSGRNAGFSPPTRNLGYCVLNRPSWVSGRQELNEPEKHS